MGPKRPQSELNSAGESAAKRRDVRGSTASVASTVVEGSWLEQAASIEPPFQFRSTKNQKVPGNIGTYFINKKVEYRQYINRDPESGKLLDAQ